jgi:hypothetical protein
MYRCLYVGYLASLRQMHADPDADLEQIQVDFTRSLHA